MVMLATVTPHLRVCTSCITHEKGHATIALPDGTFSMEFSSKEAGRIICETLFEEGRLSQVERIVIDREISTSCLVEGTTMREIVSLIAQHQVSMMSHRQTLVVAVVLEEKIPA